MGIAMIPIAAAKEGMVLSQTVTNSKGIVLSAAGTVLTARLISAFEKMGVELVQVEKDEEVSEEDLLIERQKIERRFSKINDNSMLGIFKAITLERLENKRK